MMRPRLMVLLLGVLLWGSGVWQAAFANAPEENVLAVMAISGYGNLKADAEMLGVLAGEPQLAAMAEGVLKAFTAGEGLAAVDPARPWGAVLLADGDQLRAYGFLPVRAVDELLKAVKPLGVQSRESGNGVYEVAVRDRIMYVRQHGKWAFVSDRPAALANLPDAPAAMLGGLAQRYDVAVRLFLSAATAPQREQLVSFLKHQGARALDRLATRDERLAGVLRLAGGHLADVAQEKMDQVEHVTLGLGVDHRVRKAFVEVTVTAEKGSALAEHLAAAGRAKTAVAGLATADAMLSANWTAQFPPPGDEVLQVAGNLVRQQLLAAIDRRLSDPEHAEAARQAMDRMLETLGAILAGGQVDGAMSLVLQPGGATILAGGMVADADQIEAMLGEGVEAVRQRRPDLVEQLLKTDVDHYKGVRFHKLSVPLPDNAREKPEVLAMLGEVPEVVVGIGKQYVYLAAGKDAMSRLQKAIEQSEHTAWQTVAPLTVALHVEAMARAAAHLGPPDRRPEATKAVEILSQEPGNDRVLLTIVPVARGARLRVEMEEDVLKLLTRAAKQRRR